MTAIVGVLNSQGIAIAADSAVTVAGNKVKKVYNRSNKIFTLSKFHPVGIAIYNNADFLGIPLETLIKLYRDKIKDVPFDTVNEYKIDFLAFVKSHLKNVGSKMKRDAFYSFCFESYSTIISNIQSALEIRSSELLIAERDQITEIYDEEVTHELDKYLIFVQDFPKADYLNISLQDYSEYYNVELLEITTFVREEIAKKFSDLILNQDHINAIEQILYSLINVEYIFEKHSGLVFIGFGDKEIYPSSHLVLLGNSIADDIRTRIYEPVRIIPGEFNSNILPYAQGDVTTTVLTGVDPNYKKEVKESIKNSFRTVSTEMAGIMNNNELAMQIEEAMNRISNELINKLEEYQFSTITGPLLEILAHMGKEDMSELAESLVNITSLKRKFTSSDSADESVGGPVDVAIITKGDGFIWMKRKHYFEIGENKGFMEKYFKI